jgi:urease accessory protein UreH
MDARAELCFTQRGGRTESGAATAQFPLSIWGPLAGAGPDAEVALLSGGGGLLDDSLHITISAEAGAHARIRQIGSTRLLPGRAASTLRFDATLGPESCLVALSEPYIPCGAAAFHQRTSIVMDESASACVGEVISPGRQDLGERFLYRWLDFRLQVVMNSTLVLQDRLHLEPARGHLPALLGASSHIATLAVLGRLASTTLPPTIHTLLKAAPVLGGVSAPAQGVIVVRMLGDSACALQEMQETIVQLARHQVSR